MSDKVNIVAKIDRQLRQKFKVIAAQNDVKMGDLITQFIEEYVGETRSQNIQSVSEEENVPQFPIFEGFMLPQHIGN